MLALLAAAAVTIRPDRPQLTRAQAAAMTPAALAESLLAPGHPPIEQVVPLPDGMVPPPPPDSPITLWVRLVTPADDDGAGLCTRRSFAVLLRRPEPEGPGDHVAASTSVHFNDLDGHRPCPAGLDAYDPADPAALPAQLAAARRLAAAVRAARHDRLPFPVTVDDQLGRDLVRYRHDHPEQRGPGDPPIRVVTDGRAALAALPLDRVRIGTADLFTPAELARPDGGRREVDTFWIDDWTVQLARNGDRIVASRLRRAAPPPF